ncbi:MAG: hypothetical protein R3B84_10665 [Zavarzinella sp.]
MGDWSSNRFLSNPRLLNRGPFTTQTPMQIYRGKTLLSKDADFAAFTKFYGEAVTDKSHDPFLLVRGDEKRLLVVTNNGMVMLSLAAGPNDCLVSYASSYSDGSRSFAGLSRQLSARDDSFVEPIFAIKAIRAFFDRKRLSEHIDFRLGTPDSEITEFPSQMTARKQIERHLVEMRVVVTPELKSDMQEVCEYLSAVANDPDENIDFDDAIQIGSLCGGRLNRRRDIYLFSYHLDKGDVWSFEVPRTVLDGIADGSIDNLTVDASVPKNVTNNAVNQSGGSDGV